MKIIFIFLLSFLYGCGSDVTFISGPNGNDGKSCHVEQRSYGSDIVCDDGSTTPVTNGVDGNDGQNGNDGLNGSNGHSMVFDTASANSTQCSNGGNIILLGLDLNDNLVLDSSDGNLQSAIICNGLDGQDAPPTPFTPTGVVNPCGDAPSVYDEVLIKLSNGTLIASFSQNANGQNTRFAILPAGTYITTDGDNCTFSVNSNGDITYESHVY